MTYNLTLCDQIILKSEALGNLSFNSSFLLNEDNFELTILNINGVDKGENKMECKNINNNDELEVKGEILIGSIDIDVKQLLSLKEGDKIVLDRDDDIKAVKKEFQNIPAGYVSEQLNYTNAQNFIRFFSKSTGVTPGKFRKLY